MPTRALTITDWLDRLIASVGPVFVMWVFMIPVIGGDMIDRIEDIYISIFRPGPVSMIDSSPYISRPAYHARDDIFIVLMPLAYMAGLIALWHLLLSGPELARRRPLLRRSIVAAISAGWFSSIWLALVWFSVGPRWWLATMGPMVVGMRALYRLYINGKVDGLSSV